MDEILKREINQLIKESVTEILEERKGRLDEMARVAEFGDHYDILVYMDDMGKIPHVHVVDKATRGMDFDCCVQLLRPQYFQHGHHIDTMPTRMCKEFNNIMHQPHRNPRFQNVYEYAADLWNNNNSDTYVQVQTDNEGNVIVPDYRHIYDYK